MVDDDKNDDPVMLEMDPDITVVEETSHPQETGIGGGGFSSGDSVVDTSSSSGGGVDTFSTTPTTDPNEIPLETRLREGDGTPEEALAFFRAHGFEQLTTLPTFDFNLRIWLFPEPPFAGAEDINLASVGFGFSGPGAAPNEGNESGGTNGNRGSGSDSSSGGGGSGGGFGGSDSGGSSGNSGGDTGGGSSGDSGGGSASDGGGAGVPVDIPGGTEEGGGGSNDSGGGSQPSPEPGTPNEIPAPPSPTNPLPPSDAKPGQVEPITDDDGNPIVPAVSHFADRQLAGAIHDKIDQNTPLVARLVLTQLIPFNWAAALLERHILNPLLAAPFQLWEAGLRLVRAEKELEKGEFAKAAADMKEADHLFKEAALAILAVLPFGEAGAGAGTAAERLSAKGVEYLESRLIARTFTEWARHQMWVTGSQFEHIFLVDGVKVYVDGFINRTGLEFVDKAANAVLVEVKMSSKIESILKVMTPGADLKSLEAANAFFAQLERYILLGKRLDVFGIRYVITEAAEGSPVTTKLRDLLLKKFPDLFESGFLEIISTPPPPESFTGFVP